MSDVKTGQDKLMLMHKEQFVEAIDKLKIYHTSLIYAYEEAQELELEEDYQQDLYEQCEVVYKLIQDFQKAMIVGFVGSGNGPKVH